MDVAILYRLQHVLRLDAAWASMVLTGLSAGMETIFAELEAAKTKDVRLARNGTPERMATKPSKRNVAALAERLRVAERHRRNSEPGEITDLNYLRIDNIHTWASIVAMFIKTVFGI